MGGCFTCFAICAYYTWRLFFGYSLYFPVRNIIGVRRGAVRCLLNWCSRAYQIELPHLLHVCSCFRTWGFEWTSFFTYAIFQHGSNLLQSPMPHTHCGIPESSLCLYLTFCFSCRVPSGTFPPLFTTFPLCLSIQFMIFSYKPTQ
jgi:hypothetical protein